MQLTNSVARRSSRVVGLATALLIGWPASGPAHDIPATVIVRMFVKPEADRLRLLVRVPLEAMRDIPWPVRGPGYLEIAAADSLLRDAARLWIAGYLEVYEGATRLGAGQILAARVSLPSDRSFARYQDALAHVTGPPLPGTTELIWQQALLDVLLEYSIGSDSAAFSIRPALAHLGLRTTTVLRFLPPGRAERAFEYLGDPGLVRLDPRWHQAALRFVRLGFSHILSGLDHLLFVLCLAIPFRRIRPLIAIVTSFTVAHSMTLIASAAGLAPSALWFPPLVEALIALSILYAAIENIIGTKLQRRWLVAFGFGLVHGFGFSFVLRESLQFAGSHLTMSLLTFNIGVELGQLFILALGLPMLNLLFRYAVAERVGTIILSVLVGHLAWHWMTERASTLGQYPFQWPTLDLTLVSGLMRGLMLALVLVSVAWLLRGVVRRLTQPREDAEARP
ncbi:MAG TPA: HupE/UreJ family protein [Gemmatimonadales bacterium]|nr:HupE/UreJ family protein [Gemmatimonadales bacterium]